ncbi:MAG TPA: hypothetical protein VFK19_10795, partial [Sphingomicrobium sp.]|nr:hypothetical protein [Sphingomicrobium sp.]
LRLRFSTAIMGDNHPLLNSHWRIEELLQRLVQGRVIDQFAWPYYVSIPLPPSPLPAPLTNSSKKERRLKRRSPDKT